MLPVDWRIAKQHAESVARRQRGVGGSNFTKEILIDRGIRQDTRLRRLLPDSSQRDFGDLFAADESVDHVLIARAAKLDDQIIDRLAQQSNSQQRDAETIGVSSPWLTPSPRATTVRPPRATATTYCPPSWVVLTGPMPMIWTTASSSFAPS